MSCHPDGTENVPTGLSHREWALLAILGAFGVVAWLICWAAVSDILSALVGDA